MTYREKGAKDTAVDTDYVLLTTVVSDMFTVGHAELDHTHHKVLVNVRRHHVRHVFILQHLIDLWQQGEH